MVSIEAQVVSVEAEDAHVVRSAEARGAPDHRVEHGLQVRGRAADRPQDLSRRGLLLERLRERVVLGLELVHQALILDTDDGLVREGLQQGDLPGCERVDPHATDHDDANGRPVGEKGRGQYRPGPGGALARRELRVLRPDRGFQVTDVDHASGERGAPVDGPSAHRERLAEPPGRADGPVLCDQAHGGAIYEVDLGVVSVAEPGRRPGDGGQDLHAGGSPANEVGPGRTGAESLGCRDEVVKHPGAYLASASRILASAEP
jgi:hypothetical protein